MTLRQQPWYFMKYRLTNKPIKCFNVSPLKNDVDFTQREIINNILRRSRAITQIL